MLLRNAIGRFIAKLPDHLAIPVQFADSLGDLCIASTWHKVFDLAIGFFKRDQNVAKLAAIKFRINQAAIGSSILPVMNRMAAHVNQVHNAISSGKQNEGIVCFDRIVNRRTRGIDAGSSHCQQRQSKNRRT